jgi:hypothetical protein
VTVANNDPAWPFIGSAEVEEDSGLAVLVEADLAAAVLVWA